MTIRATPRYEEVDLRQVRTYPLAGRESLVHGARPSAAPPSEDQGLADVAAAVVEARGTESAVVMHLGGHVIKCGLGPVLIELMERGFVTHLASNGAASIHDFELAWQGKTSEDVASNLEDGSFGMAEETGSLMNAAINAGARDGLGMGTALGRLISEDPGFGYRELSIAAAAYRLGIPYTVHVAVGTDIIHQHPACDFAATGETSGRDFRILAASVSRLEGGAFLNFGSAVIGPEVFLKALSVARNLGHRVAAFLTANFDLHPLRDPHTPSSPEQAEYYYRPKKNILLRPTSLGGRGVHICADHRATVPALRDRILAQSAGGHPRPAAGRHEDTDLGRAFRLIDRCFRRGGTLFACGNGGSFSDAQHIAGELNKSMSAPRPVPAHHLPALGELAAYLHAGLRTIALGSNPALTTAIANDIDHPALQFAQELYALGRPGDVLLAISTSGRSDNVVAACQVARAIGMSVVSLTGPRPGPVGEHADVCMQAVGETTPEVQQQHRAIYHELCALLERAAFPA